MNAFEWVRDAGRAVGGIGRWSRQPFDPGAAAARVAGLLTRREDRFLELVRQVVYAEPSSPYLQLLRFAGCEYGDLASLVEKEGLETALGMLASQGVFVTHDEMKGREAARRGSAVFEFTPASFANPLVTPHFGQKTSGSTGRATRVYTSLGHYRQQLLHTSLSIDYHGLRGAASALWIFPGEWSFSRAMRLARVLGRLERWFTPLPFASLKADVGRNALYGGFVTLLRLYGNKLPLPRHVPMMEPTALVKWVVSELSQERRVLVISLPAMGVRACALAAKRGISLEGSVWLVGGEPVTPAKREAIESTGARCLPLFGCTETGESAEGCLKPNCSDDLHVYEHRFALISRQKKLDHDQEVSTPLFTTLCPHTPLVFLNGDTGDVARVERRDCGCPWGELGLRTHLSHIWSYSKFTAEGMTLPGQAVMEVLEKVMPARLGGHSGHFQLVAEPGEKGMPRYMLLVSPEVGELDPEHVRQVFGDALARATHRDMSDFLSLAGQFAVVRRARVVQAGGKSLPFVVQRVGRIEKPAKGSATGSTTEARKDADGEV